MKRFCSFAAAAVLAFAATPALADGPTASTEIIGPRVMSDAEMDKIVGGMFSVEIVGVVSRSNLVPVDVDVVGTLSEHATSMTCIGKDQCTAPSGFIDFITTPIP